MKRTRKHTAPNVAWYFKAHNDTAEVKKSIIPSDTYKKNKNKVNDECHAIVSMKNV